MSVLAGVAVCLPVLMEPPVKEPLSRKMSASSLSREAQLRYMLQWFGEWSELQRQDFLPILAEKLSDAPTYMNGVVNSMGIMNCQNKPMSLFQCRIKLFNDWYPAWSEEERNRLVKGATEMDEDFGKKLQDELATVKESNLNGLANGEEISSEQLQEDLTEVENVGEESSTATAGTDEVLQEVEDIVQENLAENPMPLEIAATS